MCVKKRSLFVRGSTQKMANDEEKGEGDEGLMADMIRADTNSIANETKHLMIEAKSSFTILICSLLFMSLLSIFMSTWLAKTITNTPTSFGSIVSHYFGFDRNQSESHLTWWKPVHAKSLIINASTTSNDTKHLTKQLRPLKSPYNDFPNFHAIVLPLLFVCSFLLAILAYYARVKCTHRDFAWGAVPKIPLGRVDPNIAAEKIVNSKEADPGLDYTIVQGSQDEPVVFTLTETLQIPRKQGEIIDEGTQYEAEDIPKVITRTSSVPALSNDCQTVPSSNSIQERQHMIELLQRDPLPTLSPSSLI